jgi:hypothetical protein
MNDNDKINDLQKQIDSLVYELYQLTPDEIAIVENLYNENCGIKNN